MNKYLNTLDRGLLNVFYDIKETQLMTGKAAKLCQLLIDYFSEHTSIVCFIFKNYKKSFCFIIFWNEKDSDK